MVQANFSNSFYLEFGRFLKALRSQKEYVNKHTISKSMGHISQLKIICTKLRLCKQFGQKLWCFSLGKDCGPLFEKDNSKFNSLYPGTHCGNFVSNTYVRPVSRINVNKYAFMIWFFVISMFFKNIKKRRIAQSIWNITMRV